MVKREIEKFNEKVPYRHLFGCKKISEIDLLHYARSLIDVVCTMVHLEELSGK